MQFHHHGYVSGEPRIKPAVGYGANRPTELPDEVDVLIVGSGPAGMLAAAQLAQFPNVKTHLIERRPGRLELGQADGIQARSVETFQAFGFAEAIIAEGYRITEMASWTPDPANPGNIIRTGRTLDDPDHALSEFPHLCVNQARVLDYYAQAAKRAPGRITPDYGWEFLSLEVGDDAAKEYPVTVQLRRTDGADAGSERTIRAKYVIGCDGAHSCVRKSIGRIPQGDTANHAWGVMDVIVKTDFPDWRLKCTIHSERGSILHIPREGGHLCRIYVDLGEVPVDDNHAVRNTPVEEVIRRANEIYAPYSIDVRDVAWSSVYEVGHRVTDKFDEIDDGDEATKNPHVFICGDACHTHSAKAGQGMNVSMQDGWNISWKLGHVLEGRADASLLHSYSDERQEIAQNLIDFDREWSSMMARKPEEFDYPGQLEEFYEKTFEFPAGFMTQYKPLSRLCGSDEHQQLAAGFPLGKRFKSAMVVRRGDNNPLHLGHSHAADGRWRIYVFADAAKPSEDSATKRLGEWLGSDPASPIVKFTPAGLDQDAYFDAKVIYQQDYTEVEYADVPAVFFPEIGEWRVNDWEKVFATGRGHDIFDEREISRDGAIVVVRPDQYVAQVLPLDATAELAAFFDGILQQPK
ncbi:FAD-binding monooxygenase [Gulosibacter sp. ACHW.36C]|uniref:FAD-binding monooxygenase n=1 Tax=Gulosibacter sediminis TaxID=1729695 RepID=A0ABY4MW68_9MICO|nr:FAD-binding monooxygenase [Gulosibacter sediminis]UQN14676.1 FAD-binding monooxygenase [Gulosibacter sediminis]